MKIVHYAECAVQPWKNGHGVLRRIAASPDGLDGFGDALLWHVSIPEIAQTTSFSALPGLDRQWLLLDGPGIELRATDAALGIDVRRRLTTKLDALAFSGDWQTECTLLGSATLGLSVITRRGRIGATIKLVEIEGALPIEKPRTSHCVVVLAEGHAKVLSGGTQSALQPLDAIVGGTGTAETYVVSREGFSRARAAVVMIDAL